MLLLVMRSFIALIIGLLTFGSLEGSPDYLEWSLSKSVKSAHLDKTSKNRKELFKSKPAKKIKVATLKLKRSKVKGLNTAQFLVSDAPLKTNWHFQHHSYFTHVVYVSFLYCVKYKRGPPLS